MQGVVEIIDDLPIQLYHSNTVNMRYMNIREQMYMLINYDNEMLCYDDSKNGIYRSVVLAYPEMRVLSFAPPKTIPFAHYQKLYPEWTEDMYVNEHIEGAMIQLFFDSRMDKWEIATEKSIGGFGCFPSFMKDNIPMRISSNFRTLFIGAMGGMPETELSDLPFLQYFSKEMSYTFILKHPSESMLSEDAQRAQLYMISVYQINNTDSKNKISYVSNRVYEEWPQFTNIRGLFEFPTQISSDNYPDLENITASTNPAKVVITNTITGVRSIITTREYRRIHAMKRANRHVAYQFLCLNRINKLHGYLHIFPKQREKLMHIADLYTHFIDQLHQLYVSYYCKKTIHEIPRPYSLIIRQLHKEIYLSHVKKHTQVIVNKHAIRQYLNNKDPYEVLHLLQMDS